jgi:energy-converting hydrogenase Eha subunit C
MKTLWLDVVFWIGCLLIAGGAWLIYRPLALVIMGIAFLVFGFMAAIGASLKKDSK